MNAVLAFSRHDHRRCRRTTIKAVESLCKSRQLRLTPVRRKTLEILLESHAALGAYEVLEKLAENGFSAKPPVVYRALGFLMEQGFAHKIEQLNAFIACSEPQTCHAPCFLICRSCGCVAEQGLPRAQGALRAAAARAGFAADDSVIEINGSCNRCTNT